MVLMVDTSRRPNRVCDARCYNAEQGGECGCICDGKNHAVGIDKALSNVRDIFLGSRKHTLVTRSAQRAIQRAEERARQSA